jgi:hypothetical protein
MAKLCELETYLDAMAIVVDDHFRVHQNGARILVSCEIV